MLLIVHLERRTLKRVDVTARRLGSWVKNLRMARMLRALFHICKVDFKVKICKRECRTNSRVKWTLIIKILTDWLTITTRSHHRESADWIRFWLLMRLFPKSKRKPWVQQHTQLWFKTLFIINQLCTSSKRGKRSSVRLRPSLHYLST